MPLPQKACIAGPWLHLLTQTTKARMPAPLSLLFPILAAAAHAFLRLALRLLAARVGSTTVLVPLTGSIHVSTST